MEWVKILNSFRPELKIHLKKENECFKEWVNVVWLGMISRIHFLHYQWFLIFFLLLSGCYWQEQFCYIGKDSELIQTESYYDDAEQ